MAEVKLAHIPYKGTGRPSPISSAAMPMMFAPIPAAHGNVSPEAARARRHQPEALEPPARCADGRRGRRSGFEVRRVGLVAPAGSARVLIERLNKGLNAVLATDEVRKRLAPKAASRSGPAGGQRPTSSARRHAGRSSSRRSASRANEGMAAMASGPDHGGARGAGCRRGAAASPCTAQPYPNRPITLVIPLPPGGTNDMMARAVADKLGAALGQQVVIENRAAGGSGTVGTRQAAKAAPDGYTLLLGYTSTRPLARACSALGYDPRRTSPIGLIGSAPALLLMHPSVPVRNVKELIADAGLERAVPARHARHRHGQLSAGGAVRAAGRRGRSSSPTRARRGR